LQEQFNTLQPQIQLAEAEVKRQKELNAGKAGSAKSLQQAETELATLVSRRNTLQSQMSVFSKNADASLRTRKVALESKLKLMGVVPAALHSDDIREVVAVRAPIPGKIAHIEAKIGAFIGQNQSIAEIIDLSNLHLDLNVYEADLPRFNLQQTIRFVTTNNPSRTYSATVHTIGAALDPATKTIAIHAHIEGDKTGLVEGMSVQATVQVGNTKVTAVPNAAIASEGSRHFIFMQIATDASGTSFRRIPVNKGNTDGKYTEITPHSPLPSGAWIAFNHAFFIMGAINNTGEE
jgi:multidrug efflux pump subunit AcrA (membrane-fusion protein)